MELISVMQISLELTSLELTSLELTSLELTLVKLLATPRSHNLEHQSGFIKKS